MLFRPFFSPNINSFGRKISPGTSFYSTIPIQTGKKFKADIFVESGNVGTTYRKLISLNYLKDSKKAVALSSGMYGKTSGTFNIKLPLVSGLSPEEIDSLPLKVQKFKNKNPKLFAYVNSVISKIIEEDNKKILLITGIFPMTTSMLVSTSLSTGSLIDLNFLCHVDPTTKPSPSYKIGFIMEILKTSLELAKGRLAQQKIQQPNNPKMAQMEFLVKIMSKMSLFKQHYNFDSMADLFDIPEIPKLLFGDLYEKNIKFQKLIRELMIEGNPKGLSKIIEEEIRRNGITEDYLEWSRVIENITEAAFVFSDHIFYIPIDLPPLSTFLPSESDLRSS